MSLTANSDGLINYRTIVEQLFNELVPLRQDPIAFRRPGQHLWVGGPTLWCLACLPAGSFFAPTETNSSLHETARLLIGS